MIIYPACVLACDSNYQIFCLNKCDFAETGFPAVKVEQIFHVPPYRFWRIFSLLLSLSNHPTIKLDQMALTILSQLV